jgi:membrane protein implicated in regulation of membrane protease activity
MSAVPFALMAIVAFYDLVLELTTGQMITIIADTVFTLDPLFFAVVVVLSASFAVVLVLLALSIYLNTRWQKDLGRRTLTIQNHAISNAQENQ